jgi:hypothetical protein
MTSSRASSAPRQKSRLGKYYVSDVGDFLSGAHAAALRGKVQLVMTSPPFPLNEKKSYGNLRGTEYRQWLSSLAGQLSSLISPGGSIVIELGNAWVGGRPVQSTLHLEALLDFLNAPTADLRLCQQFVCYNPTRLPSPAQWVTVNRIRTTDSFTHIWWMAKSDFPKADNRKVLRPYGDQMKRLLARGSYNDGRRPSEHRISTNGFLKDHGGSIAHNLLELEAIDAGHPPRFPNVLRIPNTRSTDFFLTKCRERKISPHPARMPPELAAFFINFLTDPGDLVLDPFAGSNTTGFVAELLERRWVAVDALKEYVIQSKLRFQDPRLKHSKKLNTRR